MKKTSATNPTLDGAVELIRGVANEELIKKPQNDSSHHHLSEDVDERERALDKYHKDLKKLIEKEDSHHVCHFVEVLAEDSIHLRRRLNQLNVGMSDLPDVNLHRFWKQELDTGNVFEVKKHRITEVKNHVTDEMCERHEALG